MVILCRLRSIAYGQKKSFANGWAFIVLVVLWLRSFGIKGHIVLQSDWGGDEGKIEWVNRCLGSLDAEITRIQKGRKEQNERHQFPIFDCLQLGKMLQYPAETYGR